MTAYKGRKPSSALGDTHDRSQVVTGRAMRVTEPAQCMPGNRRDTFPIYR